MYVDPTTGSIMTQLLLSAGVGTVLGFRRRLARMFKPRRRPVDEPEPLRRGATEARRPNHPTE
jgi:hypothetical protein